MNPRVTKVEPLEEYKLKLHFTNNEVKIFDTNPYLNKGIFKELKNNIIFNLVLFTIYFNCKRTNTTQCF